MEYYGMVQNKRQYDEEENNVKRRRSDDDINEQTMQQEITFLKHNLEIMNRKYVELCNANAELKVENDDLKQQLNLKHENSLFFQYAIN